MMGQLRGILKNKQREEEFGENTSSALRYRLGELGLFLEIKCFTQYFWCVGSKSQGRAG